MQRALLRLSRETFDLLIVGGGVTGACVARDAALRGMSVALVEKGDFAGARKRHKRPQFQAHPWRPALPAQFRAGAGARIAARAPDLAAHRPASGAAPALP